MKSGQAIKEAEYAGMGEVVARRKMMRVRADGQECDVTIEVSMPKEYEIEDSQSPLWISTVRISLVPRVLVASATSSLDAIINAIYLASAVLKVHPYASEIDMSLLPNFNLPLSPISTTPEALAEEQNRLKVIKVVPTLQNKIRE